jgi:peptidoglycan/xylan/chitin deacetylase (PgdA/CDA1 family)
VPSFQEHIATLRLWAELPGLERIGDGAVLTFDDGPDPDATPAVLDALDAAGAQATFFMVGEQVGAHPELAAEVAERGHEIQLHCYEHVHHEQLADPRRDIARAFAAIELATGARPSLQRPPYGRFSASSFAACTQAGLEPVYWSAWGEDWEMLGPDRIADLVTRDLAPGVVILLHDSPRYGHRPSAKPTADAIPLIAAAAADRGLPLRSISASRG